LCFRFGSAQGATWPEFAWHINCDPCFGLQTKTKRGIKMYKLLFTIMCAFTLSAAAGDIELAKKFAVNDLKLQKKYSAQDRKLQSIYNVTRLINRTIDRQHCDDDDTGAGSASCWDKCSAEGWSSSTCSDRCGTSTGGGSASCWDKCSAEGWGSSTCSDRCGTSTGGGSAACWDKCTAEGWGSSTCSDRCGTN